MEVSSETAAIAYVSLWLPDNDQAFYLSNGEIRAMINGDGGTRSYANDLAQIIVDHDQNGAGVAGVAYWEGSLRDHATPGGVDNFDPDIDPLGYTSNGGVASDIFLYSAGCPGGIGSCGTLFELSNEGLLLMYELIKGIDRNGIPMDGFLRWYVEANPTRYGGPPGGNVNLAFNPTWVTQDPV